MSRIGNYRGMVFIMFVLYDREGAARKRNRVRPIGGCYLNFRCSAGFQPALSRQDGGATFKFGQHQFAMSQKSSSRVQALAAFLGVGTD